MTHLTSPNPEFDHLVKRTPPGMMFWSGTCADPTATCDGCRYYNLTRKNKGRCSLYQNHTGRAGAAFDKKTPACKYFQAKNP